MASLLEKLRDFPVMKEGPFELKNAGSSQRYFDFKKTYGNPNIFQELIITLASKIDASATCIAAAGYGGIPLATAIAFHTSHNLVLVRDEVKSHGTKTLIDGYLPKIKDRIAIVDDVFTTGKGLKKTISTLAETGASILGCYVLLNRNQGNPENLGTPLLSLYTTKDFLEISQDGK